MMSAIGPVFEIIIETQIFRALMNNKFIIRPIYWAMWETPETMYKVTIWLEKVEK